MSFASAPSPEYGKRTAYPGALFTAAALAALVSALVVVLLTGPTLFSALADLTRGPTQALAHAQTLALLVGAPLASAALAALAMWRVIWLTRVTRYTRFLHEYCEERLRRDAPLVSLGLTPTAIPLDLASTSAPAPRPLAGLLAQTPQALLLGGAGAGKTTALLVYAQTLSSRSLLARLALGVRRESLPVLISLPALAAAARVADNALVPYVASQLRRHGTAWLGARAAKLLRAGRIALLCDDYDQLDDEEREMINRQLQTLREPPYSSCRIVVACESSAYAAVVDDLGPMAHFGAVALAEVNLREFRRAIRKRQSAQRAGSRRAVIAPGEFTTELQRRPLSVSLQTAAVAAALTETVASDAEIAWGRATLLRDYLRLASATANARDLSDGSTADADAAEQPALVWTALAASLQEERHGYLLLDPALTVGENVQAWLATHAPPSPTDFVLNIAPDLPLDQLERDVQAGIRTGMLRRSLDGRTLSFCHSLMQASAAAWWLDLRDDGMGRLNSQLLRPHWALPVALWAGALANSDDLAQRVFRFANSPDSIAPRAGVADRLDVCPQALALALAAILEGATPQLSAMIARKETHTHGFLITQQGLRDLLDACVVYGTDPQRRVRLSRALARTAEEVGREFIAYLGALARESELDRLLRAQCATTLGLTASAAAIDALMSLLMQPDPTVRQAVAQALIYLGASAIPALHATARTGDAQTRRRVDEAVRLLKSVAPGAGEAAGGAALAGLASPDAAQRRIAVTTLSAIGASGALNELIARLDDVSGEVRLAAASALGQLGGKRAQLALRRRATSDDPRLRLAVAQALGVDPATASTPTLLRLLKDADPRVRAAAAAALGAIADKRAISPLRAAAEDDDPWVRHAAQTAVKRYGRM